MHARLVLVSVLLAGCAAPSVDPAPATWACDPCASALPSQTAPVWEPSAAADPADPSHIVVAYRDGSYDSIVTSVTRDGGRTWQQGKLGVGADAVEGSPARDWTHTGDAVVAFAPGRVLLAGLGFTYKPAPGGATYERTGASIFVASSTDGGLTFPKMSVVAQGGGTNYGGPSGAGALVDYRNEDKEWLAVGPDGTLAVVWTALHPGTGVGFVFPLREPNMLYASVSKDGGATWSAPVAIEAEGSPSGGYPVFAEDGTLHVAYRYYDEPRSFVATSKDGGGTWTKVEVGDAVGQPTLRALPGGVLLLAFPSGSADSSAPALARSDDAGATWSAPRKLGAATQGRTHVSLDVAADGTAYVGWYHATGDSAGVYRVAIVPTAGEATTLDVGPADPTWDRYGDYVTGVTTTADGFSVLWNHEGADGPVLHHARYALG